MAATAIPYPLVNGVRHSWASVEMKIALPTGGNRIILGVTEVNYNSKLDPGIVRGAGSNPIAFTRGNAEHDGDFTILLEEFRSMINDLGDGWMGNVIGDLIVSYSEEGSGLSTIVDTLKGVRVTGLDRGASSGSTDPTVRKCSIKYLGVLDDGINPMPAQPVAAA